MRKKQHNAADGQACIRKGLARAWRTGRQAPWPLQAEPQRPGRGRQAGQRSHQQDEGAALPIHHRIVPPPLVVAAEVLAPRLLLLQLVLHLSPGSRAGQGGKQCTAGGENNQATPPGAPWCRVQTKRHTALSCPAAAPTPSCPAPTACLAGTHLNAWAVSQGTPLSMLSSTSCTWPPEAASQ